MYIPTFLLSARDTVKALVAENVQFPTEFSWLAQLRYYWENDVIVRMITTDINYGYEYLGNSGRLVITPLTDRCYRYTNVVLWMPLFSWVPIFVDLTKITHSWSSKFVAIVFTFILHAAEYQRSINATLHIWH